MATALRVTETGGRDATARVIPGEHALSVGMPRTPAPRGWKWSPLTTLARLESGHTPSRKHLEYWNGTTPWISLLDAKQSHGRRIQDTIEHTNDLGITNSSARLLPENTVCLSRTASVGYVVVMGRPMATSQDFVNWVCSDELDPDFLKYLFLAEGKGLLRFASGAVHQTIYFPEAKAFHVCHPPVSEQRRIVRVLDKALNGVAAAKASSEKNALNASALIRSAVWSALSANGPEWLSTTIGQQVVLQRGFDITKKQQKPGRVPVVSSGGIKSFHDTAMVQAPGIVLGRKGTLGKVFYLENDFWPHDTTLWVKRFNGNDPRFVYYFFSSLDLAELDSGAANPALNRNQIHPIAVTWPPVSRQKTIVKQLDALSKETERLKSLYEKKLTTLNALKRSLFHHAFTGAL